VRHQLVYDIGYNIGDAVRLTWFGQIRSGLPFTPVVASDINGDGLANDRAFVADPARMGDSLGTQMRSLLAAASARVRDCLRRQLGTVAGRNSCEGPMTGDATLVMGFNSTRFRLPQRASVQLQLGNALGAADYLFHGPNRLHGWGQPGFTDPQLLFVRGFNASTLQYSYDVNPRFGDASFEGNTFRVPVTLTALVRVDIGPTRERQSLTQMLDQGRTRPGDRATEAVLKATYGTAGVVNPIAQLLRQGDTLGLNGEQADSLASVNLAYTAALDSIWTQTARGLANLPTGYDQGEAYHRYRLAREASIDRLIGIAPRVEALLTDAQKRRLPPLITRYLDVRYLAGVRSGTAGDAASGAFTSAIVGAGGEAVQRTDIVIRRP
jgi:hypothetical protein